MGLRFGVVGTAYWAREIHLPGLRGAGANVVGLWGRTGTHAEVIASSRGIRAFSNLSELLREVDVVTIAVSPEAQAPIALEAAEAGKHMILEKPLSRDVKQANAIAAAITKNNLAAIVFFLRRFVPEVAAAISAERGHPWTRAYVNVRSAALMTDLYANSVWRRAPGGALWDVGPHVVSVLVPMMGHILDIEASSETDGVSRFRSVHENGGIAEVSMTLRSRLDEVSSEYRFVSPSRDITLPDPELFRAAAFSRAVRDLVEAVASGRRDHECGVGLGVETVRVLAAAERRNDGASLQAVCAACVE